MAIAVSSILNIPVEQAEKELQDIESKNINCNSILAQRLGLTNEMSDSQIQGKLNQFLGGL